MINESEHKHRCEVREILRMAEPKLFLAEVAKRRGREAADALWAVVRAQYALGNRGERGDWR